MKLPPKDDREAADLHASKRDRKIAERDKPTDNRKAVGLIAKLGTRPIPASRNLPKRNAKKRSSL